MVGRMWLAAAGVALAAGAACSSGSSGGGGGGGDEGRAGDARPSGGSLTGFTLETAFHGIAFTNPVKLVQHPSDDDRWYVVEQIGFVHTFLASDPGGTRAIAADVDAVVNLGSGNEEGLLGMAFDPGFAGSGEIYLFYNDEDADALVIDRWVSGDGGSSFAPDAIVLSVPHPGQRNHNGGDLEFGPDGFLYVTLGDGGGSGDPDENGQNPRTLLGSILRLDVNGAPLYAIPPGNPFAGNPLCSSGSGAASCPEIYAYGLRNPWRFRFDPVTGALWAGDVGQNSQEEIDRIVAGGNYGWDCREGTLPFEASDPACETTFVSPDAVHPRTEARSITGGAVYRGSALPALLGFYVYGDFVLRNFFTFDTSDPDGPVLRLVLPATSVAAFGQGRDGEIYVVSFGTPSLLKLVAE